MHHRTHQRLLGWPCARLIKQNPLPGTGGAEHQSKNLRLPRERNAHVVASDRASAPEIDPLTPPGRRYAPEGYSDRLRRA